MDLHDFQIVAENYDYYARTLVTEQAHAQKIDFHLELAGEYGGSGIVDFTYDRTFSLAMIPASGFMHLTTPEDQRKALSNINRHLEIGGVLTLNTFDPHMGRIAENLDEATEYRKRTEFDAPNGNRIELGESVYYDPSTQLIKSVWQFAEFDRKNRKVKETEVPLRMRYTYRQELRYLLELTGFRVEHLYGSYDRRDAVYPSGLVWVARRVQ